MHICQMYWSKSTPDSKVRVAVMSSASICIGFAQVSGYGAGQVGGMAPQGYGYGAGQQFGGYQPYAGYGHPGSGYGYGQSSYGGGAGGYNQGGKYGRSGYGAGEIATYVMSCRGSKVGGDCWIGSGW